MIHKLLLLLERQRNDNIMTDIKVIPKGYLCVKKETGQKFLGKQQNMKMIIKEERKRE